jgi:hypothetical protein
MAGRSAPTRVSTDLPEARCYPLRMAWLVRQAQPSDFPEVRDVVASAFGREAEAQLVDRLHASDVWLPGLALVARPSATPRGRLVGFEAAIPTGIHGPYDHAGPAFQALVLGGANPLPQGRAVYPDLFAGL